MRLKVYGGTPKHDESLCDTCTNAMQRRGVRFSDRYYGCSEMTGRIPQPVTACTQYDDTRMRLPMEVSRMAFRWVPSLGTFLSPVEYEMKRANSKLKPGDY